MDDLDVVKEFSVPGPYGTTWDFYRQSDDSVMICTPDHDAVTISAENWVALVSTIDAE